MRNGLAVESIQLEKPVEGSAAKSPALRHLERELYAYPGRVFPESVEDIQVFAATIIYTEVETIAATIISLS